ncbi:hypothetical protein BKA70DRAFT_1416119 [Coprinopsis sp. MPI-PUGE-AT-0042]|nr:hypothetical protein BKA70DRAFT_1416119 [Coprinopsis sp. MPI-PUGE-AT-0042]
MATYTGKTTPRETSSETHPVPQRFSAEAKGKHRDSNPAPQVACFDRAPMSSSRSTLQHEDPPAGVTGEGRLENGNADSRAGTPHGAHPKVHHSHSSSPRPAHTPALDGLHPSVPSLRPVPSEFVSRYQVDDPMSQRLALKTPAFGTVGLNTAPHWSVPIYERQLIPKALGFPLAMPTGLAIGDVYILTTSGKIQKCFNIREHHDMPHYMQPLHPSLSGLDICTYTDFPEKSYIASHTLKPITDDPTFSGLAFQCDANTEAAVLVFPQGASTAELRELSKFREYIAQNATNWARYIDDLEEETGESVKLRVVTGTLTSPFWANAVVVAEGMGSVLRFAETKTVDGRSAYFWDTRGFGKAAVSASDAWNPASRNDCTIVKCFTISARREREATSGQDVPFVARYHHPCDIINERLLSINANVSIVASHDRDWCAVMKQGDMAVLPKAELEERVLHNHDMAEENGALFLRWKNHREKKESAEDLKKQIEDLKASLDGVDKEDTVARAKLLHTITTNILAYIQIAASKTPQVAEVLLSAALVNAKEEVASLSDKGSLPVSSMHLLASTMWTAFEMAGDPKLLDQSIASFRQALAIESNHKDSMSDLARGLWARYGRYKQDQDLYELIELYKALLYSRPVNNPNEVKWLNGLGMGLMEKYRKTNEHEDMIQALHYLRWASRSYPTPCDPFTLSNLGNVLMTKSRHFRNNLNNTDVNEAIIYYRMALTSVSPLNPGRSAFLSNLADALMSRYERTNSFADLNEAVRLYEQVLELPVPHHRDKVTCIMFYASALQDRFKKAFDMDDLTLAIKKYKEAKLRASPAHPSYAKLMEKLIIAEQEQRRLQALNSTATPPPPSRTSSPATPVRTKPSSRTWASPRPEHVPGQQAPEAPSSNGANGASQKFRIVRPPMAKPYSRKPTTSATDSDASSPDEDARIVPISPRTGGLPPRARRPFAVPQQAPPL